MKKYILFLTLGIKKEFQYKENIMGLVLTSIFSFFIQIMLWKSIYNDSLEINGINYMSMFLYIVFGIILNKFLGDGINFKISKLFRTGDISLDLSKPYNLYFKLLFENLGRGIFNSFIIAVILSFFMFFSRNEINLVFMQFILYLFSALLSYLISFTMSFLLGLSSFWFGTSIGLNMMMGALRMLLSGSIIPIDFYPENLQFITQILPFRHIHYTPLSFILKEYSTSQTLNVLFIQLFWLILFVLISVIIYKKAKMKLNVQGG